MHASEVRRYLEGRRQRALDKEHARKVQRESGSSTSTSSLAERKRKLESNRQSAREDLLDEVGG